jgi:hypothetical protein
MENIVLNSRIPNSRFTLIDRLGPRGGVWKCRCDCGAERPYPRNQILSGKTRSCGCLVRDTSRQLPLMQRRTHGMEGTAEYRIWVDMRRRCNNPGRPDYKNYGGRGIKVCDEWNESFEAFYRDMGPRPEGHTLDRMNNAGPYDRHNCVWATRKHQERNKRSNRIVHIDGRRMTVAEAAEIYGIPGDVAIKRMNGGMSMDDAFKKSLRQTSRSRPT